MRDNVLRIGGASGFWGDAAYATAQLLADGDVDVLVYDYLAEVTLSILARARAQDPDKGYAADFVTAAMAPNLRAIRDKGVKVVSNAGGLNPGACAAALAGVADKRGLDLRIAVVLGDDLVARKGEFGDAVEMFSSEAFPDPDKIVSINAYLGAAPIAQALKNGADIVITGRCVDSAVTLGACLAAFDWPLDDFDRLAQGSLAGHIIECGPQATGGNFTDWRDVEGLEAIGYPIVEIAADGGFAVTKPKGSGGLVSRATVAEQIVYEIGDPQTYLLPDVICDFSAVELTEAGPDLVKVTGAKGRAPADAYKVSATWLDGWRAGVQMSFTGFEAREKARAYATAALARAEKTLRAANLGPFAETSVEVAGDGSVFGAPTNDAREVALKVAAKHADPKGVGVLIREMTGLGLATPAGLSMFAGGRPKPSPVVRLFSFTLPKPAVEIEVRSGDAVEAMTDRLFGGDVAAAPQRPAPPEPPVANGPMVERPLIELAWARSGDKGDKANIGVIARRPDFLPWIWAALDEAAIADATAHFSPSSVDRYLLPGFHAVNVVLHDVLGGGGAASLRADPQGKAYAQILLTRMIEVPEDLVDHNGRTQ